MMIALFSLFLASSPVSANVVALPPESVMDPAEADGAFCQWEYVYVCGPYGCQWVYHWICY